jgi:hypothetical protein
MLTVDYMDSAEIADAIGVTRRRVQQLEREGVLIRDPANNLFARDWNGRRFAIFKARDFEGAARELERAGEDLQAGLDRLAQARTKAKRDAVAVEVGPAVGRFDAAMRLINALLHPGQRALLDGYADAEAGAAISQFLAAAQLKFRDDP